MPYDSADWGERLPTDQTKLTLARVPIQEAQGLLIELGRALVNRSVGAGLEHHEFAALDAAGQRIGKSQRGDLVVAAEGDLGRGRDTA